MIKNIIRFQNDMVMVFDEEGEQISKYQGQYQKVKQFILEDAPLGAIFANGFTKYGRLSEIARGEW
ncbi:MAG: hypothetical protein PHQ86_04375 [Dehalococcoidales bacterium]|nr:hypothetical protein [Dehalococcoidales bacterium]